MEEMKWFLNDPYRTRRCTKHGHERLVCTLRLHVITWDSAATNECGGPANLGGYPLIRQRSRRAN